MTKPRASRRPTVLRPDSVWRIFRRDQAGATLVELALVVPILVTVSLTIVDLGMGFYYKTQLQTAAEAGAQYALNNRLSYGANWSTTNINNAVINATALTIASADISTTLSCRCVDQGTSVLTSSTPASPSNPNACTAATNAATCSGMGSAKPGAYVSVTVSPPCPDRCYKPVFNYLGFGSQYAMSATAIVRIQ